MSEVRAIVLSLLTVLGAFAVVAPASLASPAQSDYGGVDAPLTRDEQSANDASMGGQVSTFMHASAGQTSESVEAGMWTAAVGDASDGTAIVERRADAIENRIAELDERKRGLIVARSNGDISESEYEARMSAVVGRMAALNRSIDETEQQARATGANVTRIQVLRAQASNLSGPEVSTVARSMAGGPPEGVRSQGGPPDDPGPPNGTTGPGNEGNGPGGNGQGPGNGGGPNGNGANGVDDGERPGQGQNDAVTGL